MTSKMTGLTAFKSRISALQTLSDGIDKAMNDSAAVIENNAKAAISEAVEVAGGKAEVDFNGMMRGAFYVNSEPLKKEIGVQNIDLGHGAKPYPAYVEFGTGGFVEIPNGLEAYAQTFYVNGKGRIMPHAFLFPAVENERQNLVNNIKALFKI